MRWKEVTEITLAAIVVAFFSTGCGTVRETLPGRAAMEQMLISTAADRAVDYLPPQIFRGKKVHLDTSQLEAYDQAYIELRIKSALRRADAQVVAENDEPDIRLEVASGALSIDKKDWLLGLPSLPLPVSVGGEPLKLPEVPFWKHVAYRGKAKLLFSPVAVESGKNLAAIPMCYGQAKDDYWWFLIFGPFRTTDMPSTTKGLNANLRQAP